MTWFVIAPYHRIATGWLGSEDRENRPWPSRKDIAIVTPANPERLRGCRLREGDRLIWVNRDWLPNTVGTADVICLVETMKAAAKVPIEEEHFAW